MPKLGRGGTGEVLQTYMRMCGHWAQPPNGEGAAKAVGTAAQLKSAEPLHTKQNKTKTTQAVKLHTHSRQTPTAPARPSTLLATGRVLALEARGVRHTIPRDHAITHARDIDAARRVVVCVRAAPNHAQMRQSGPKWPKRAREGQNGPLVHRCAAMRPASVTSFWQHEAEWKLSPHCGQTSKQHHTK